MPPRARIIWAHTGFHTPPENVEKLLARHSGLRGELPRELAQRVEYRNAAELLNLNPVSSGETAAPSAPM